MSEPTAKRFAEFAKAEDQSLDGDKMQIGEILNKEVLITGFRMLKSKCAGIAGKELLQLQFEFNGQKHIVFTNSTVLIRQVTEYAENMPYYATVRKKGSYYTFT